MDLRRSLEAAFRGKPQTIIQEPGHPTVKTVRERADELKKENDRAEAERMRKLQNGTKV